MAAKHVILCIHGIGSHKKDWVREKEDDDEQTFEEVFKEKWEEMGVGDAGQIELRSINYDNEIDKIFESWEQYARQLREDLGSSPLLKGEASWFTERVEDASTARQQKEWSYTHLLDLILFVGSPTLQNRLVNHVGEQIYKLVQTHRDDADISIIAHSMGCAVAHKAIQALFSEGVRMKDGTRQTIKGDFMFENVCMVANTSYALSRDRENHYWPTIVRPSMTVGEGCCYTWLNINHKLDPVAQFQRFDHGKHPKWLDPRVKGQRWCRDVPLDRISSKDIHSLTHYFRDPECHVQYFELAFGKRFSDKALGEATARFLDKTPEGRFKALESHFKALDTSNLESFRAFCDALKAFRDLVRNFSD